MKNFKFLTYTLVAGMALLVTACSEPETPEPTPTTTPTGLTANLLFVNASPDAPALDLFVNNVKAGATVSPGSFQSAYVSVPVTMNGSTGNTNIRAKAASGTIGGVLGTADMILRAGNNNSNNFQISAGTRYTIFSIDSINRPRPLRTLNAKNIGDTTYYNPANGKLISVVERAALAKADRDKLVPVGTVPLGSSDPGGSRFLLLQDVIPTFVSTNVTQAAIRFINAVPNATGLWVRLRPAAGSNVTLGSNVTYAMSFAAFTGTSIPSVPSVGSRTALTPNNISFGLQTIAAAGTPIAYTLEVSTNSGYTSIIASVPNVTFTVGKVYTVYARGLVGKTGDKAPSAAIIQHN